jgi:hypothetical protein
MYQGPANSSVHFTCEAYPDVLGHLLRAVIGPDTVSAGTSTTLSSSSIAGATTLSTVASVAAGKIIKIDTGSLTEYAKVSSVSGSGPYSLTLSSADWTPGYTGLKYAHSSAVAVVSQTLHTFAQNPAQSRPSYSLTRYNGLEAQGFPGCVCSELQLKIDPKGAVTADAKFTGWPSAIQVHPDRLLLHPGPAAGLAVDHDQRRIVLHPRPDLRLSRQAPGRCDPRQQRAADPA